MLVGREIHAPAGRTAAESEPAGLPSLLRTTYLVYALALVAGLAAAPTLLVGMPRVFALTGILFLDQDALWIAFAAILVLALPVAVRRLAVPAGLFDALARQLGRTAFALAASVVAVAAFARFAVLGGFALARDEIMAEFDTTILRSGRLLATLPADWQAMKDALNPEFLLPVHGPFWVSSYLPGNAALRAAVGSVMDPGWTSPLLAGIAMLALYRIARRLWPDRPDAAVVSLILLAASSQMLVMATTNYAMTAHLALNLVWLALFLRDDRIGHAGAMGVGAVACGLHQVIFHPLFVAPFILHLWVHKRRALAVGYMAAYAVIGMFWASYWQLVLHAIAAADPAGEAGAWRLAILATQLLANFSPGKSLPLMLANLLRFLVWQHLLLVPLACAAAGSVRRGGGIARPLVAGIILTVAAASVLLPYQGHGWGYRYLHGLIGNLCLLGGYGWIAVTAGGAARERATAWSAFAMASAFALLVMLPVHVAQAARMIAPYRAAVTAIERAPVDVVFVDITGIGFGVDLVRNDPFLRNRPKVLDLGLVSEPDLAAMCARYSVAVFDRRQASALGVRAGSALDPAEDDGRARRRSLMAQLGCGIAVTTD